MKLYKRNRLIHGVGINDADYHTVKHGIVNGKHKIVWRCDFHMKWMSMVQRCYSPSFQSKFPTYKGCTVCNEWLTFSVFKSWMEKQDWQGLQLDKDIIEPGNKVYSPSTCVFIPRAINVIMTDAGASRGECPIGVCRNGKRFQSQLTVKGKSKYLGLYSTIEEASDAYKQAKSAYILDVIEQHPTLDERVKQSLTAIAEEMSS